MSDHLRQTPDLQDLYPTPKTHEQRRSDRRQRESRRLARRSRWAPLRMAIGSGLIFLATVELFSRLEAWWSSGITGVSFSYVAGIILMIFTGLLVQYVNRVCEQYALRAVAFFFGWIVVTCVFGGAMLSWLDDTNTVLVSGLYGVTTGGLLAGVLYMKKLTV